MHWAVFPVTGQSLGFKAQKEVGMSKRSAGSFVRSSFSKLRALRVLVLPLVLLASSVAWSVEPLPPVFENALVRYVMTRTVPGTKILSQVTATEFSLVTESTYSAFLQRMGWQQNAVLRDKLGEEFQGLDRKSTRLNSSH